MSQNLTQEKRDEFRDLSRQLIKWLNDNVHPHHTIIITCTDAELLEGSVSLSTKAYLKD